MAEEDWDGWKMLTERIMDAYSAAGNIRVRITLMPEWLRISFSDDGAEYQEYTLVIYLSDTDIDAIHAAADELLEAFNQSSILIQANPTRTEFYSGR